MTQYCKSTIPQYKKKKNGIYKLASSTVSNVACPELFMSLVTSGTAFLLQHLLQSTSWLPVESWLGKKSLQCPALITGSVFFSIRGRKEIVALQAPQANLGLLVNLAVRVPQAPQVLLLQVRTSLLHLVHSVSLPEGVQQRSDLKCLQQFNTLLIYPPFGLIRVLHKGNRHYYGFDLAFLRTNRGEKKKKSHWWCHWYMKWKITSQYFNSEHLFIEKHFMAPSNSE